MITLKQMEALVWIAKLGTFERAAKKLCTTQSAISKRMRELETTLGVEVFDRSQRGARLTEHGELVVDLAEEMLGMQTRIMGLQAGKVIRPRRISIGVTELSALTWFPKLISTLRETHENISVTPVVDSSRVLLQKLLDDELDIIACAGVTPTKNIIFNHIANVSSVWMAQPGLVAEGQRLQLTDLAAYPILSQGGQSGTGQFYKKWLKDQGFTSGGVTSDNLIALVGLTVAGLGICYLPHECYRPLIEEKKLVALEVEPSLPPVPYYTAYKADKLTGTEKEVARLIEDVCDFSSQFIT